MSRPDFTTRVIKQLASLKLAVVIMIYLAILTSVGTIVESRYDAIAARKLVYDTWWMYVGMIALSTSLIAVMVDRWPWRKKHTPFVLAHIGILILLFGSILTMKYGLDGTVSIEIGKTGRQVMIPLQTDIVVYASFDGQGMTKLHEQEVDFLLRPPTPDKPLLVSTDAGPIEFLEAKPYVIPSRQVFASELTKAGAGVRFQVRNERVNVIEWLVQKRQGALASHDFGPAQVHLGPPPPHGREKNEIYLEPQENHLRWTLFRKDSMKPAAQGRVAEGEVLQTGWMGLELRVLRYFPTAREEWDLKERDYPTPLTTSAVKVRFQGREQWILLNDTLRLFTEKAAYFVSYMNRRIDLGFPIQLVSFEMVPYPGTNRAREYKSHVQLPDLPETVVSMNEPAKYQGLTIYQASFQNDDEGKPIASVFSVNHDPGRFWKYLGSLILSLGIIALFWFRRSFQSSAPTSSSSSQEAP